MPDRREEGSDVAENRVWVWLDGDDTIQHLAPPPDDVAMRWSGVTACDLEGPMARVSFENVDTAKACQRCAAHPYTLAGDSRGLP